MVERPTQSEVSGSNPTPPLQKSPLVRTLSLQEANILLEKYHYLGPVRTASLCLGHEEGCTVWGTLRSRGLDSALRLSGFQAIELIRMVGSPFHTWAMSSLLSISSKLIFKQKGFDALITYADKEQGHTGSTYLAANWIKIQDAQPDGFTWYLDGNRVSRKRFFNEFGSSSWETVQTAYGSRIRRELDIPKSRFILPKNREYTEEILHACLKKKTWGLKRTKSFYEGPND